MPMIYFTSHFISRIYSNDDWVINSQYTI